MKYYFNTDDMETYLCLDECTYKYETKIGSIKCSKCENFIIGNPENKWIECKKLTRIDRKIKLDKLKNYER